MSVSKRPQVIRDLIELATYIAEDNLDASDCFLAAAEATFNQLAKIPQMGKLCQFSNPTLADIRQQAIKGFKGDRDRLAIASKQRCNITTRIMTFLLTFKLTRH
jgi:plasmid stabilization system protein ParE